MKKSLIFHILGHEKLRTKEYRNFIFLTYEHKVYQNWCSFYKNCVMVLVEKYFLVNGLYFWWFCKCSTIIRTTTIRVLVINFWQTSSDPTKNHGSYKNECIDIKKIWFLWKLGKLDRVSDSYLKSWFLFFYLLILLKEELFCRATDTIRALGACPPLFWPFFCKKHFFRPPSSKKWLVFRANQLKISSRARDNLT